MARVVLVYFVQSGLVWNLIKSAASNSALCIERAILEQKGAKYLPAVSSSLKQLAFALEHFYLCDSAEDFGVAGYNEFY